MNIIALLITILILVVLALIIFLAMEHGEMLLNLLRIALGIIAVILFGTLIYTIVCDIIRFVV